MTNPVDFISIKGRCHVVTPLAGVWIEIFVKILNMDRIAVTPLAGVWIEIMKDYSMYRDMDCHSPRGSVD